MNIKENVYLMPMIARKPHIISVYQVAHDKSDERIQTIVDGATYADYYCTDGYFGYLSVIYHGKHIYNCHNKNRTFAIKSVKAYLRYISLLTAKTRKQMLCKKHRNTACCRGSFC